jgi:hypothetical protein
MSKLIAHILVGVLAAAILMLINATIIPVSLRGSEKFDCFMSLCYVACIVVSCAIYYIKTPPGKDNRG